MLSYNKSCFTIMSKVLVINCIVNHLHMALYYAIRREQAFKFPFYYCKS